MIRDVNGMRNGHAKNLVESQLAEYISHVCTGASGSELNSLTAMVAHERPLFNERRGSVVSCRVFIRSRSLIAR